MMNARAFTFQFRPFVLLCRRRQRLRWRVVVVVRGQGQSGTNWPHEKGLVLSESSTAQRQLNGFAPSKNVSARKINAYRPLFLL